MAISFLHPDRARGGLGHCRPMAKQRRRYDIDPELIIVLARQIPTLETDALVRLMTSALSPGGERLDGVA
jgi:hypothetical protein